jgi:hypothetical protein
MTAKLSLDPQGQAEDESDDKAESNVSLSTG